MMKRIAVLGAMLFAVTGVSSLSASPTSEMTKENYFTIDSVSLYEVVDGKDMFVDAQPVPLQTAPPGTGTVPDPAPSPSGTVQVPAPAGGIDLGQIIAIGEKIWSIIEANRPVVVQNYAAVSAVPQGIRSWEELNGWSEPTIRMYKLAYKNLYKMKVVEFNFRVAYTYNGSVGGRGKYLSRVEIDPAILNVAWGYKFNASGEALNITNVGTPESPMAAMEIRLNWSVDSVMRHMQESVRFYIRGDGLFKNLSDGSMPIGLK